MNTAKMTLILTVLAASLALMAAPNSALADHCKGKHKNDPGCEDSGGKPPKDSEPADPVIVFMRSSQLTSGQRAITVMDADGGNQTVVLDNPGGGLIAVPSWSPDGMFLAFTASQNILGCRGTGLVEFDPATNEWSAPVSLGCDASSGDSPTFHPIDGGNSYTLAQTGFHDAIPTHPGEPNERITSDLLVVTFTALDINSVIAGQQDNISNTPGISESSPSWSPSGTEIVVQATDISDDPSDPSTWVRDIVIYNAADGTVEPSSLVTDNPAFVAANVDRTSGPDWAKTNEDMILFSLRTVGSNWDIYCVERDPLTTAITTTINVTQHIDVGDGVELDDWGPAWLPDDSGFLFSRDSGDQIVEMRFGKDGGGVDYDPSFGCPDATNLATATTVVLANSKRRQTVGMIDYWRGPTTP